MIYYDFPLQALLSKSYSFKKSRRIVPSSNLFGLVLIFLSFSLPFRGWSRFTRKGPHTWKRRRRRRTKKRTRPWGRSWDQRLQPNREGGRQLTRMGDEIVVAEGDQETPWAFLFLPKEEWKREREKEGTKGEKEQAEEEFSVFSFSWLCGSQKLEAVSEWHSLGFFEQQSV